MSGIDFIVFAYFFTAIFASGSMFHSNDTPDISNAEIKIKIDTARPLHIVEDFFISYTIDSVEFQESFGQFNFSSKRLHTLLGALSPSILRVGGSAADWLFFDKPSSIMKKIGLRPEASIVSKKSLRDLVELTRSTGNRLLFDLNLQLRFGSQWDPSNAIDMMRYLSRRGYAESIDWELGNEPQYQTDKGQIVLLPTQIANDFVILHKVLRSFPGFNASRIVGPDVVAYRNNLEGLKIIQEVVNLTGSFLSAVTFHHYYFRGDIASYKDYLDPKYFDDLPFVIDLVQSAVAGSGHPATPLWLGETSDAWHSGTANVSDRFVSSFLWLDKLGMSASKGVRVVMRQTLYGGHYSLLDVDMTPNPDFWLCAIHKALVGKTVCRLTLSGAPSTTRAYAHCTSNRTRKYRPGSVTVFALNSSPITPSKLVFDNLQGQPIDVYLLSPVGDVLSRQVYLNANQVLVMPNESEMPELKPVRLPPHSDVTLPPLTIGFFVFPDADLTVCRDHER